MGHPDFDKWWTAERIKESDAAWLQSREYLAFATRIRDVMQTYSLKSIIELGCGAGYIGGVLATEFYYIGIDGSAEMVEWAKLKNPGATFLQGNLRNLEDIYADLVCCFSTVKHFSLTEWRQIVHNILQVGEYGLIEMQISTEEAVDTSDTSNIDFHHTFVPDCDIEKTWRDAGHEIIDVAMRKDCGLNRESVYVISKRRT